MAERRRIDVLSTGLKDHPEVGWQRPRGGSGRDVRMGEQRRLQLGHSLPSLSEIGDDLDDREGVPTRMTGYRLTRADWEPNARTDIAVHNLNRAQTSSAPVPSSTMSPARVRLRASAHLRTGCVWRSSSLVGP